MNWFGVDDCEPWGDPINGMVLAEPEVTVVRGGLFDWVFDVDNRVKHVGWDCKILRWLVVWIVV